MTQYISKDPTVRKGTSRRSAEEIRKDGFIVILRERGAKDWQALVYSRSKIDIMRHLYREYRSCGGLRIMVNPRRASMPKTITILTDGDIKNMGLQVYIDPATNTSMDTDIDPSAREHLAQEKLWPKYHLARS